MILNPKTRITPQSAARVARNMCHGQAYNFTRSSRILPEEFSHSLYPLPVLSA